MLDSNLMSLLSLLSESDYLTSQTLAVKSGASSRTVQTRIGQLRAELEGHGATIESRHRHGYRLQVNDRDAYEAWYSENRCALTSTVPDTVEDRFRFLLARFLDEGFIRETQVDGRKRTYRITPKGRAVYQEEVDRLRSCLMDAEEESL